MTTGRREAWACPRIVLALAAGVLLTRPARGQDPAPAPNPSTAPSPPPDGSWVADAAIDRLAAMTDPGLGAAQGVAVRDGMVYAYGDVYSARPRVGVIREYFLDLATTGREVRLTRGGSPLIIHPTGLTWDPRLGTFLGDTVLKRAVIYRLDWARAWADGDLDDAVLDVLVDDAAINGCRPTLVTLAGRTLLATADYGDVRPRDPPARPRCPDHRRADQRPGGRGPPGAVRAMESELHWDEATGRLTCVQNIIEGRGWRLDEIDLARAVADGRASAPGCRARTLTFAPHDELEGYWPLDAGRALFAAARRSDNVIIGTIRATGPTPSPAAASARQADQAPNRSPATR